MKNTNSNIHPMKSVGSLMDKSLNYENFSKDFIQQLSSIPSVRHGFETGGSVDPIDQEILELEMYVGLRPSNSYDAHFIEMAKDRLFKLYELKKKKQ